MRQLLNLKAALYAVAALLALAGVSHWFIAIFIKSSHEVVYTYDVTVSYCTQGICVYSAMLQVANTGHEVQPQVEVAIAGLPPGLGASPKILNLDASFPREADPGIEQRSAEGVLEISLREFSPGTLVEFSFRGLFPEDQLQQALDPALIVTGQGRIIEGDPRGVAFGRFFSQEDRYEGRKFSGTG